MKKLTLALILIAVLWSGVAFGATYYVATTGSDAYNTTQAQDISTPWLTIQKALDTIPTGTHTLYVAAGVYTGSITFNNTILRNNVFYGGTAVFNDPVNGNMTLAQWKTYWATNGSTDDSKVNDSTSINSDPLFISATDFHLQPSSPAVGAGVFISGVHDQPNCTDLGGIPCNSMAIHIGAYGPVRPDGTPIRYPTQNEFQQ